MNETLRRSRPACSPSGSAPPDRRRSAWGRVRAGRPVRPRSAFRRRRRRCFDPAPFARSARKPSVDLYARETLLAHQPKTVAGSQTFPVANSDSFAFGVKVRQLLYDFGQTDATVRASVIDTRPCTWTRP